LSTCVGTERSKLTSRRFALKKNGVAFVFGMQKEERSAWPEHPIDGVGWCRRFEAQNCCESFIGFYLERYVGALVGSLDTNMGCRGNEVCNLFAVESRRRNRDGRTARARFGGDPTERKLTDLRLDADRRCDHVEGNGLALME
jgi:hypothetical protein